MFSTVDSVIERCYYVKEITKRAALLYDWECFCLLCVVSVHFVYILQVYGEA